MKPEVTVGVVACNRYEQLRTCLLSLKRNLKKVPHQIIVIDGCLDKRIEQIANKVDKKINVISPKKRIGPSESRKIIADHTETEYLLFLDDDIIVPKGTVEMLLEHLESHPEVSIVSGAWKEYGKFRELGQIFIFGQDKNQKYIFKKFITVKEARDLGVSSIKVHGVMSSMLARTEVFEKINFDERYDFFYELFDFFLQAYYKGIQIEALPNAVFYHRPSKYRGFTLRHAHSPEVDRKKFIEKWGIIPIGQLGLPISKSPMYQIRRRLGI